MTENKGTEIRILIADPDGVGSRRLADFLTKEGFACQVVPNGKQLRVILQKWVPHILMTDLLLPEGNAIDIFKFINEADSLKNNPPQVLVTSAHNSVENVRQCFKLGASDYVVKPYNYDSLLNRLAFILQDKKRIVEEDRQEDGFTKIENDSGDVFIQLVDIILREASSVRDKREILFNLTKMLAMTMQAVRCSVIECNMQTLKGTVMVSSDDANVKDIQLDLNGYPEVTYVMNKEEMLAVENLNQNPILAEISKRVRSISFNALLVCPIRHKGLIYGVVSVRLGKRNKAFSDREVRFVRLVSNTISLVLDSTQYLPFDMKKVI